MSQAYVRICKEDSWGDGVPGAPTWKYFPIESDAYNLRLKVPTWKPELNVGYTGRKFQIPNKHDLSGGRLQLRPQPANIEFLLWMGWQRDANDELNSYVIEYEDSQRVLRHSGVRVATMTFSSEPETGPQFEFDITAKAQATGTTFKSTAKAGISGVTFFKHQDCAFTLQAAGGSATSITTLTNFSLSLDNNLNAGPHLGSSHYIAWLKAGLRSVSFDATFLHEATTWIDAMEAETKILASFIGQHPAGGTDARFTIHCADGNLESAETPDNVNEPTQASYHFEGELDSANNDILVTVGDV